MNTSLLPNLDTFAKAAELSSFTAAGRELGISQAAVSQHVQALERVLTTSLFHRQGGRVFLTEAGQSLYDYAQKILRLHQEARECVTGKKEPLSGELLLAVSTVPGELLVPELLKGFRERHPHIRVRVAVSDSAAALAIVEHGKAPLGLVGSKAPHPLLEFRPFARDEVVLVVPPRHPWARRREVTLAQLAQQPLVLREIGSGSRECLEQALAQHGMGIQDLQIGLELGSNEAIKESVRRGLGLAFLSKQAVQKEVDARKLRLVRVAELNLERDLFVVWDKRRVLSAPARLFLDFLGTAV